MIPEFESLRQEQLRTLRERGRGEQAAWLDASRALSLCVDLFFEAVMQPDGTVVVHDYLDTTGKAAEGGERITMLVAAAEKMPPLRVMLPLRPGGAFGCHRCEGSRRWHGIICPVCHGLGWVETQPSLS